MIKFTEDYKSNKSGEILSFSKGIELALVKKGVAMFVKIPEPCYKFK